MTMVVVLVGLVGWSVIATIELIRRDGYRRMPDRMGESRLEPRLPASDSTTP